MATVQPSTNGSHTKETLDREMQGLKDDLSKLTAQVSDLLSNSGSAAWRRAKRAADGVIADASGKGQEAVDAVRDVTTTVGDALEDAVYKRPVTTLAMAAGIGFLIGAIWRR
ncbi:MAG: DUF883 family protein [Xanthobacteraceae bacterium]|nr:DUF883 family protein [Xanthobacteraceae bacterium]QYK45937.1 MAG: DUF883 family protein [Xanthobacteraceae bacterium]